MKPTETGANQGVTIFFYATFGGRDNWSLPIAVPPGESLISLFSHLEEGLYREIKEKLLDPDYPGYALSLDGKILSKEELNQARLQGSEKITIFARLAGG
jgi:hypothetical protein